MIANAAPADPHELQHAFALFSLASEQLSGVYQELQQQVERLTRELAAANGELRQQLAEKESLSRRLGALLAALPAGVVALDPRGQVEENNPIAGRMLGSPLLGNRWQTVAQERLCKTDVPGEWTVKCAATATARRVRVESSSPDPAGRRILLVHDVTDAHAMQERLKRNERLAAMGEMAAGLAHQLRTPLAAALLYTTHLGDAALAPGKRRSFADKALERLRHLEHLIRDLLLFVKGETAAWETVAISPLLEELREVIEPQMSRRGVQFTVRDRSAGEALKADRNALSGALTSLLENALQASPEDGRVALDCTRTAEAIVLTVRDEGPGIPQEIAERMFEPFFTTRTEGTGLGLAMARAVAQSLGGTVQARSAPGGGSEFVLRLPRQTNGAQPVPNRDFHQESQAR